MDCCITHNAAVPFSDITGGSLSDMQPQKNLYTTFSTYAGALAPRPVNTSNVEKWKVLSDILRDEFKNTTNNVDFNGTDDAEWS